MRAVLAASFLSVGLALSYTKSAWPSLHGYVELSFGLALAWASLGDAAADRLTVVLGLLAAGYAMASGVERLTAIRLSAAIKARMESARDRIVSRDEFQELRQRIERLESRAHF